MKRRKAVISLRPSGTYRIRCYKRVWLFWILDDVEFEVELKKARIAASEYTEFKPIVYMSVPKRYEVESNK